MGRLLGRLRVGATFISVTGILAFYQTRVPFHRKGKFLGNRDFFGELNAAAKKRGIRTIARMSPDLNWGDALQAHPEWFQRDAQGNPRTAADDPDLLRHLHVHQLHDGLHAGHHPRDQLTLRRGCHLHERLAAARQPARLPLRAMPPTAAPGTPAYWDKFNERVHYLWKLYDSWPRRRRPATSTSPTPAAAAFRRSTCRRLGTFCEWFQADNQGRGGQDAPIWGCTLQGRVCNAVLDGKMATNVAATWSTGPIRWRQRTKSPAEAHMWLAKPPPAA